MLLTDGGGQLVGGGGVGHGVEILTYMVKSIKIPYPQASKGQLHTLNSFKFSHPADIMETKIPTQE